MLCTYSSFYLFDDNFLYQAVDEKEGVLKIVCSDEKFIQNTCTYLYLLYLRQQFTQSNNLIGQRKILNTCRIQPFRNIFLFEMSFNQILSINLIEYNLF